jgi:excisionase family DNA binding protein
MLGISRAFAYEAVRRGEIPSIRIGRRVLVPRAALERMLNSADDLVIPPDPPRQRAASCLEVLGAVIYDGVGGQRTTYKAPRSYWRL